MTSPARYRTLYRYVRDRVPQPSRTKIWCILFLADMESYLQTGASITGATWYKMPGAPRPRFEETRLPMPPT